MDRAPLAGGRGFDSHFSATLKTNNMKTKGLLIQGDVMLIPCKLPSTKPADQGAEVLALGETSGHGHVAEKCEVLIGADDTKYLLPKKDARLLHKHLTSDAPADHRDLILPALQEGWGYKVVIQNEYSPEAGIFNTVLD